MEFSGASPMSTRVEKEMSKAVSVHYSERLSVERGWIVLGLAVASWAILAGAWQVVAVTLSALAG
jgi:hypothetical protein